MSNSDETGDNDKKRQNLDNKLNDLFNLPNTVSADKTANLPVIIENNEDEENLNKDFEDTRKTLIELEEMGKNVLDHFVEIARESESPRAIEVLSTYMKTLSEISLSKLTVHERKKALKDSKLADDQNRPNMNIQNANIIVGTTAEYLAQKRNRNQDDSTS